MYSPLDIEHKEFRRSLFGYDRKQIRDFLQRLAEHTEDLLRENKRLTKELDNKGTLIEELQTGEIELKRTVVAAERISNEMKNNAEREAHLILKEAEQQKEMTLREAKLRHKELSAEISRLEKERDLFREQFRGMLRAFERGLDATKKVASSKPADTGNAVPAKPSPTKTALSKPPSMKQPNPVPGQPAPKDASSSVTGSGDPS